MRADYKCTACGHVQQVTEVHTPTGVYAGSGANWCDRCGDGKPERVVAFPVKEKPANLSRPEGGTDLEKIRAAFRAAGLADGGIESINDVGPELLWQIADLRKKGLIP